MPNWVINEMIVEGKADSVNKLFAYIKPDENDEKYEADDVIDFNKIKPMPKSLDITEGSITTQALAAVLTAINPITKDFGEEKVTGDKFVEIMNAVRKTVSEYEYQKIERYYVTAAEIDKKLISEGRKYLDNILTYGATTWYGWRLDNWGTKWEASGQERVNENTIRFQTAWSTPAPLIKTLSELFPDVKITMNYADEDIGSNTGVITAKNGKVSETAFDTRSKEAMDMVVKLWDINLKERGYVYDKKQGKYIYAGNEDE